MSKIITPVRIQRSRQHRQISPNGLPIVYVGRPSKYGNRYRIIPVGDDCYNVIYFGNGAQLLVAFALCYDMALDVALKGFEQGLNMEAVKHDLKNKNLSCWCKPEHKCHADILLKIANKIT